MFDIKDLFSGGKQLAGLDIGSSCIKLAEIQDTPKGRILSRFSQMPLAKGVIVDGAVVEPEALTATIKELYKQSGCKRKKVVTSISGHAVIVKKATFAQMDEEELRALIHDEAGKYLPFDDMSAVDYDFQILGENPYNPSQMEVLIVAAKKEIIEGYTEAIQAAGLIPMIMDVDSFALETMYEENYEFDENDVAVLINIGASITNLNAVKGGVSIFTRDFTLGGNSVTEALAANLGVPFEEAEKAKIEGIGRRRTGQEDIPGGTDHLCGSDLFRDRAVGRLFPFHIRCGNHQQNSRVRRRSPDSRPGCRSGPPSGDRNGDHQSVQKDPIGQKGSATGVGGGHRSHCRRRRGAGFAEDR